jgi:murein DD-endopeptidase MepM/ murein hydrolase activator NlpD
MRMRKFMEIASLIGIVLLMALMADVDAFGAGKDGVEEAERLVRDLHAGKAEEFYGRCTDRMRAAVPLAKLQELVRGLGALEEVLDRGREGPSHVLRCRFPTGNFDVLVTLDGEGRVDGLFYRPAAGSVKGAAAPPQVSAISNADYQTKTRLSFPFRGKWTVVNGGRDASKNNHSGNPQQTFAYDFVRAHKGAGKALEDYEAFGAEVSAPADGTIEYVVDGAPDVSVGETDVYVVPGNHVAINHGNGEWSYLAHFKRGSIRVKAGEHVTRGQVLGLCGNSGNTSEPHIHFHLANAPRMYLGAGLPARFSGILVDGKPLENAEPERGQTVENATP